MSTWSIRYLDREQARRQDLQNQFRLQIRGRFNSPWISNTDCSSEAYIMNIHMRLFALAGFILLTLSASQTLAQSGVSPDSNMAEHATTADVPSPNTVHPAGNATNPSAD